MIDAKKHLAESKVRRALEVNKMVALGEDYTFAQILEIFFGILNLFSFWSIEFIKTIAQPSYIRLSPCNSDLTQFGWLLDIRRPLNRIFAGGRT